MQGKGQRLAQRKADLVSAQGTEATQLAGLDTNKLEQLQQISNQETAALAKLDADALLLQDQQTKDLRTMSMSIEDLVKEAIEPGADGGSIYTHDVHLEKLTKTAWDVHFKETFHKFQRDNQYQLHMAQVPAQLGAILTQLGGAPMAGQTTVNNVTVAPSSSNSISSVSKSENVYGTVDPYTSAAGAYG